MWGDMSRGIRIKRYCSVHIITIILMPFMQGIYNYDGCNFNSGNYLFTTDTK